MAVPLKYREIGDFHKYYSGELKAPYLTIFIGGNHESSGHMRELYYGGWAAPNIYFMGAANVIRVGPLRIAGMSGIWKGFDYRKGHVERLPFSSDDVRSCYHIRELDVRKLLQIRTQIDIGLSHDWPAGMEWLGDHKQLFRIKSYFEEDARNNALGSKAATYVLDHLRPPHWLSGHMHCRYAAVKKFEKANNPSITETRKVPAVSQDEPKNDDEIDLNLDDTPSIVKPVEAKNDDEIDLDLDDDEPIAQPELYKPLVSEDIRAQLPASFAKPIAPPKPTNLPHPAGIANTTTNFLALDKLGPNRHFLQLIEVESSRTPTEDLLQRPLTLSYDPEWLAITRAFKDDTPLKPFPHDKGTAHYLPVIEKEQSWVEDKVVKQGKLIVPENFELTAPVFDPAGGIHVLGMPREYSNPQTRTYCELLDVPNYFHDEEDSMIARFLSQPEDTGEQPRHGFNRGGGHRGGRGGGGRGRGRSRGRGRGRGY
jgi:lariat debranching enzyme